MTAYVLRLLDVAPRALRPRPRDHALPLHRQTGPRRAPRVGRMTGRARPLCIGICAPYDLGREGGVNSHIRAQATALRRLGHSVVIFGASSAPLGDGEIAIGEIGRAHV